MNKKHKNQSSMNHQMINTVCFNNIRINNKVHMIIRGNDMKVLLPHITDELLKHNIKKNVIHSPNIYTHTVCVCACVCVCVCVFHMHKLVPSHRLGDPYANLWRFLFTTSSSMILCSTNPVPFQPARTPPWNLQALLGSSLQTASKREFNELISFVGLPLWLSW